VHQRPRKVLFCADASRFWLSYLTAFAAGVAVPTVIADEVRAFRSRT
jgi:hypothetical protein